MWDWLYQGGVPSLQVATSDYFEMEAMRRRAPLLYHQYIGQYTSHGSEEKSQATTLWECMLENIDKVDYNERYAFAAGQDLTCGYKLEYPLGPLGAFKEFGWILLGCVVKLYGKSIFYHRLQKEMTAEGVMEGEDAFAQLALGRSPDNAEDRFQGMKTYDMMMTEEGEGEEEDNNNQKAITANSEDNPEPQRQMAAEPSIPEEDISMLVWWH